MVLAIILAVVVAITLLLVLSRYAADPAVLRERAEQLGRTTALKPDIDPGRLRYIVIELLEGMGLRVIETEPLGSAGGTRLVATGAGVLRDMRHIIYIEPSPAGRYVDGTTLLALSEDVTHNDGVLGVVVTPCEIDRSGVASLTADLELIDGRTLLALINEYLPTRAVEMGTYRLPDATISGWPSMLHERVARGRVAAKGC